MKSDHEIAVLIVLFRQTEKLKSLLISLKEQTFVRFRVFAIENDFQEQSLKIVSESFPDAVCVPYSSNLGYGAGNNILAYRACELGYKYLFIVNPDIIIESRCIENLYKILQTSEKYMFAGPVVYKGTPQNSQGVQIYGLRADFTSGKIKRITESPEVLNVNMVSGCAFLIKSDAIEDDKLFNENNFMYGEEVDLAYRLFLRGYTGIVTMKAIVWHDHECESNQGSKLAFEYYYKTRNRILFLHRYDKHGLIIYDIIKELIISPIRIRWLVRTAGLNLVSFYYKGYIHGLMNKNPKIIKS